MLKSPKANLRLDPKAIITRKFLAQLQQCICIISNFWNLFLPNRYATSDGSSHQEAGQLKNIGSENEAISVTGQFQYVGDDGQTYTVNYVADENGFQPQGAHLPVAPQA